MLRLVSLTLSGLLLCSACSSGHEDDVRRTAREFEQAVEAGDWARACAQLAPTTRDDLVQSAGAPCDEALADERLPPPGSASEVAVFGTTGQVRYDHDTLFLSRHDGDWRVDAAGCTVRHSKPYDCQLQGG
ncbi:hypothetical protein [Nocardioides sp. Root151]|uniref:hypothetical protein n=1 Tax=Nocardioides sp. Root151 TaxID=1736475 RepID=UPI0007027978|nr:hypothetical protein [Nocardioides sp. Root151]KQZ70695.1 hypothetical protein ASD66_14045 [Nocardioides sp. Root151]